MMVLSEDLDAKCLGYRQPANEATVGATIGRMSGLIS
jgi:hypothetical protein